VSTPEGLSPPERPHPPGVERLLSLVRDEVTASEPAALTVLARRVVDEERSRLADGAPPLTEDELAEAVVGLVDDLIEPQLALPPPVINATGVILHTNLGRAPWPEAARRAAIAGASTYGYLELDQATGRRGPRFRAAEDHLVALTGAEDALVVTNNAAALLLAVGLAGRRGAVVVSRGELVEIGGGVRIPEIVTRAGVRLIEVGTTNRTRAADFEPPLVEGRATVVLRVHPSNFAMEGFTEMADLAEVAELAHRHGAIVIDDLGSGALLDTAAFGLAHEPTPAERLAAGADVVLFSGDKLVGGPQAGMIVGRRDLVARMRRDPLARAIRPDKAILAAVATTLAIYRAGRARLDIPVWRTIALDPDELRTRAEWIVGLCRADGGGTERAVRVLEVRSPVGGGSLPGQTLPSFGVAVAVASPTRAAAALRRGSPRILARVEDGELVFDLRTVRRFDDGDLVRAIDGILARGG
jgi:L-seryl-tRNA(Ser) seleniumtransferase